MTTIFVLLHTMPYEGSTLLGVYEREDLAKSAWDTWSHKRGSFATDKQCDIREVVVGAPAEWHW